MSKMIQHIALALAASVFAVMFAGCKTTATARTAPAWVASPASVYADSEYLSAVGFAANRKGAENAAIAEIGKTIRQTVRVATVGQEKFSDAGRTISTEKAYSATVNADSELEHISGITIRDVWTANDGTVYALALLNRAETGRYYKNLLDKNTDVINAQIVTASKNSDNFDGYSAAKRAISLAEENSGYAQILSAVNPKMYSLFFPEYGSTEAVREFTGKILQNIKIAVVISGESNSAIVSAFTDVLTENGLKPTVGASAGTQNEIGGYSLNVNISITDAGLLGQYQTVRYAVDIALKDNKSGTILLPLTLSGRESHATQSEARVRAIRTICQDIQGTFANRFAQFAR